MVKKYFYSVILTLLFLTIGFVINNYNEKKIAAIIIPHHDLVRQERKEFLNSFGKKIDPNTILLISPDHFASGHQNITTTKKDWNLGNKIFESDKNKIENLTQNTSVKIQDSAFTREHGIFNVLGDIKDNFSNAKIIPLIIKENTPQEEIVNLNKNLNLICKIRCLLISSIDFSHYQPSSVAKIHDIFSLESLYNLDENQTMKAEVDSPASLTLTVLWAKAHGTKRFNLNLNTNSGLLTNEPDSESTSYVLGWFEKGIKTFADDETFVAGLNLNQTKDTRLITGIDEIINLDNKDNLNNLCYEKKEYCDIISKLQQEPFKTAVGAGMIVTGQIKDKTHNLVLSPSVTNTHVLLRGNDKLDVINNIRKDLDLENIVNGLNYDKIEISY